jgi:hypothetical protein
VGDVLRGSVLTLLALWSDRRCAAASLCSLRMHCNLLVMPACSLDSCNMLEERKTLLVYTIHAANADTMAFTLSESVSEANARERVRRDSD